MRNFLPGPIDASKSRLVRPANTVVCCASAATLLYIEPRDEFGNGCVFERDVDAVRVRPFSNQILIFTSNALNFLSLTGLSSQSI